MQHAGLNLIPIVIWVYRYQREEAKIQAWVNLQNAKAEAQSRKLEVFSHAFGYLFFAGIFFFFFQLIVNVGFALNMQAS